MKTIGAGIEFIDFEVVQLIGRPESFMIERWITSKSNQNWGAVVVVGVDAALKDQLLISATNFRRSKGAVVDVHASIEQPSAWAS